MEEAQSDNRIDQQPRARWSCCLTSVLTLLLVGVLLAIVGWLGREWQRNHELAESKDRWERQIADVKAGKIACLIWPEPRFLKEFVKNQPDVAAKVTEVQFDIGKVSDKRFGYLRQLPHLEAIYFYEVWEGADSFLSRMAGMKTVTKLSFSKTCLSKEGIGAVARFPNLKRLQIDWAWKGADLTPLRGQRSIETLDLEEVPITPAWITVIASLPKLKEVIVEDGEATAAQLRELQKAVPHVEVLRGK